MGPGYGPPWAGFFYGGPRRPSATDMNIRVSDAERNEMSDILAKHYADGRLDDEEFKSRMEKAVGAKTRGDLSGLLSDLPPLHEEEPARRRPRMPFRALSAILLLAFLVAALGTVATVTTHIPWILLIVVFFFLWHRHNHGLHHRHYDRYPADY